MHFFKENQKFFCFFKKFFSVWKKRLFGKMTSVLRTLKKPPDWGGSGGRDCILDK